MTSRKLRCGRCESPVESDDLRCPVCRHAAPAAARLDDAETSVEILRCQNCGAAVTYDVRARAPKCAFCGSKTQVEVPEDPIEQTEFFLPFTVDRGAAESAYRRWLGGLGWFRPRDLVAASSLEWVKPLWWVGWVFDSDATVCWTADSNAGTRRADWAPHAGETEIEYRNVVVSASRGLRDEETHHLVSSYDIDSALGEAKGGGDTAVIERFDVQRSSAREQVMAMIERVAEERLKEGHIPGTRFRNLHVSVLLRRLVRRRYAFPSYVLAYRYNGALYRTVLSGQDENRILGTAPYSTTRILLAVFGGAIILAAALAAIVALFA
jgi:transcription elongation factor Elf1